MSYNIGYVYILCSGDHMIWILYIFLACLCAALAAISMHLLDRNRVTKILSVIAAVLLSIAFTKEYVVPRYLAYTFAQSIRNASPLIDLIAKNAPDDFNYYINMVQNNILNNGTTNEVYLNTNNFISSVLIKNIPYASNASIYRYLTVCLALDKELMRVHPRYVLFVEYPGKFSNQVDAQNIIKYVNPATVQALLSAKQDIIVSALENRQPNLKFSERMKANFIYTTILTNLSAQYGRKMMINAFQQPNIAGIDEKKAAEIIIQYYEDIIAKGPDGAALIYKSLYSTK